LVVTSAFVACEECINKSSFCFIYKLLCSYSWNREWLQENCKGTCRNLCSSEPSCGVSQVNFNTDSNIAKKGSSPWQAVIKLNGRHLCSGALISSKWVLSAAHCIDGLQGFTYAVTVSFGEYELGVQDSNHIDVEVEQIITHPLYNAKTKDNDISLIQLKQAIKLGPRIIPICLPQSSSTIYSGSRCYISGYGSFKGTDHDKFRLQHSSILAQPKTMCDESNATITDRMICIKGTRVNACLGDIGGLFVCQDNPGGAWRLNGVLSWGSQRCGSTSDSFTVFTKVAVFRQWIDQTTEK